MRVTELNYLKIHYVRIIKGLKALYDLEIPIILSEQMQIFTISELYQKYSLYNILHVDATSLRKYNLQLRNIIIINFLITIH